MSDNPKISVVIPAYNEEKYIGNVLEGLGEQTFKDFEVIVSDNDSTDGTVSVVRKFPGVRITTEKKRGIAINRNTGAKAAGGEVLVFLDADTKPSKDLLMSYSRIFSDRRVVAATGPIIPLEKVSKRVALGYKFVSVLFVKASILFGKPSIVGINFAVRRDAFNKVGGFNESFVTYEDYDLSSRLMKEGEIAYLNDAVVQTSARRVKKWGIFGFFLFHAGNMARYTLLKKPKEHYEPIR